MNIGSYFIGLSNNLVLTILFIWIFILFYFILIFFVFLPFLGPLPMAYGGSQARGLIKAVATSLHQSNSNAGSKPHLRPTPQLTATLEP